MAWQYNVLEVVRVVDGDTVDLRIDLGFHMQATLRFRLMGVDTPERGDEGWDAATSYTRSWMGSGGRLNVTTYKSDSFGRWLADVYDEGGAWLNRDLITSGHAKPYIR